MQPEVVRSEPEDVERLAAIIVAAFRSDPFVRWMLPDDAPFEAAFRQVALRHAALAVEQRAAHHTSDYLGAALWLPPGVEPSGGGDEFSAALPAARRESAFELFRLMQAAQPSEAHWHLRLLGVEPAAQGRGHGSELLRRTLAVCDAVHQAAFLEATSLRSRALYERHGFEVTAELQVADSPPLWAMLRPAR